MSIAPTILRADPGRELRWRGSLPIPGLFQGEHVFELQPLGEDRTRFVHRERFSGLLVPLLWKKLLNVDTRAGFEAMNRALKQEAERAPSV